MSVLSDSEIKELIAQKKLIIAPYFDDFQGPNCYYCHLGNKFYIPKKSLNTPIDIMNETKVEKYFDYHESLDEIILHPGEFVLGETFEQLGTNNENIIRLYNTTSLARWGVYHAGLGFVNAGCGYDSPIKLTIELVNLFSSPLKLKCTTVKNGKIDFGIEVIKICVVPLSKPAVKGYGGEYQGDNSVALSRMNKRLKGNDYVL